MNTRRSFIKNSALVGAGSLLLPTFSFTKHENVAYGVQLYTFRDELAKDAKGTLKQIADLGIKKIESARSSKGLYYGLTPNEMKKECENLGMKLVSGHVALDENFDHTMLRP